MHPSFAEALIGNDNAENNLEIFRPLIVVHRHFDELGDLVPGQIAGV